MMLTWLVCWQVVAAPLIRPYWPVTVDQLASGQVRHTHVRVTGRVTLVRHEQDGDLHLKLVGRTGFVVAECIPLLARVCPVVQVGQTVTVRGISRRDGEHHWWEVHPIEYLTIMRP